MPSNLLSCQRSDIHAMPVGGGSRRLVLALAALLTAVVGLAGPRPAAADLLVTNATFLTMKAGEPGPVVGYMLAGC